MADGIIHIPLSGRSVEDGLGHADGRRSTSSLRHFVAGPENHLVEVAVRIVLDDLDRDSGPIFLHGQSGTGKSHIAWGLVAAWKARHRRRPAIYLTATDFARKLANAIEAQGTAEFRHDLLRAALLVVEDVGRLKGKQAAQWELASLLDELLASGSRVVITASAPAEELPGLLPRLKSRLAAGLTVPLVPPGRQTRLALLQQWAALRGVSINDSLIEVLASGLPTTAPELFGAIVQLEAEMAARSGVIDLEAVQEYVEHRPGLRRVAMRDIATATSRRFSLRTRDLQSASRRREVVRARGVAMYLARELTGSSLHQIGVYFGGRDHTTVLHACRRTEELMHSEPAIRQAIDEVRHMLGTG